MKTLHLMTMLLLACGSLFAQSTVTLRVVYEREDTHTGELYQYSERYLGTKNVITENGTAYTLRSVETVDRDSTVRPRRTPTRHTPKDHRTTTLLTPLSEEALMATSIAKKAESVAKQIYRIREARMSLLSGEAEHCPADGQGLQIALNGLNKQEEELTALFVGTTCRTVHTTTITYTTDTTVTETAQCVLMRFSRHTGPVPTDDLSGEPVYAIQKNLLAEQPATHKKAKKGQTETYIQSSMLSIRYNGQQLLYPTPVQ